MQKILIQNLLHQGIANHSAGQLAQAEQIYGQVINLDSNNADAFNLLGLIEFQTGRLAAAEQHISKAVRLGQKTASYRNNLGLVLHAAGKLQDAEIHYRKAVQLQPDYAEAHYNLANCLRDRKKSKEAEQHYRRALHFKPDYADAYNNLGLLLINLERYREAEPLFQQILLMQTANAPACNNLGIIAQKLGRYEEAQAHYQKALQLNAGYAQAHNNLGNVLADMNRFPDAQAHLQKALQLDRGYADAHNNLGNVCMDMGQLSEAEAHFREAVRLGGDEQAGAHATLGMALLRKGEFSEGWKEYEWRLKVKGHLLFMDTEKPLWRGEPAEGKRLLLYAEQGLGDTLQFCRYASLVAQRARVTLKVQQPLVKLLSSLRGIDAVVTDEQKVAFDMHCPLMSLPFVYGTTMDTIPSAVPYLNAPAERVVYWKEKLAGVTGRKVGLAWSGNPKLSTDVRRSIAAEKFDRLAGLPGTSFISLQKGAAVKPSCIAHDWTEEFSDMAETAALIENLDLVISVDTSVAHLAGALGKPVWLLNRYDSEWRWLQGRDDSPWYPTLRQFRQTAPNDWDAVLERAAECLANPI